jgi:signal transduction histidine kinase
VRTTLGATVVVGIAMILGALILVAGVRRSLTDNVKTTARLRAEDVIAQFEAGAAPEELAVDDQEDAAVQVVDPNGRVVAASANAKGRPPLADVPAGHTKRVDDLPLEKGHYLVAAVPARRGSEQFTVLVAASLEPVEEGLEALTRGLMLGIPVLLVLVAGTTWVVTGRALRPVEAIREEVETITDEQLSRRVPEPNATDEIARLARTMNEMLARLEVARGRQQRFVSDASHELRSPLATIRHELELLLDDPARTDVVPMAEGLMAECLRMQGLVDDLLLLARSDETPARRRAQPVDLDDVVLAEAARLRARGLVQVDATRVSAGQVLGDQAQLTRMVRNLADNAERHARGSVRFDLEGRNGAVVLAVRDDGPGVAVADRDRIFERFTRLDAARARGTGGSGLGLAIVAEVVATHDGSVAVGEEPDGGARFTVTLPAAGS